MSLCHYLYSSTGPLSVDKHLKIVREVTWDVRSKWYDLGIELRVSDGTLKVSYSYQICMELVKVIKTLMLIHRQSSEIMMTVIFATHLYWKNGSLKLNHSPVGLTL